jgi:hypothetical protein
MDQITYDYLEPKDDPDVPQLDVIEKAMEYLEQAAKAYRANPPRWSEGAGYVEEAFHEISKIN